MPTVESQGYRPNKEFGTLATRADVRRALTESGDFHSLPLLAHEMGFREGNNLRTRAANIWWGYNRPEHKIPNFAGEPTIVNSQLAIYENDKGLTQAVLKTSEEPYSADDEQLFRRDLEVFTKHYIERPRIWGFPARATTTFLGTIPAVFAGALVGGAIDYGSTGGVFNEGAMLGEIVGPVAYGALWWLSERYARGRISAPDQYVVGDNVTSTLLSERRHVVNVTIQQELYGVLKERDPNLLPDDFLEKIYGQLPPSLLQRRSQEVERVYSYIRPPFKRPVPTEAESTLPHLLGVAHILQAAA